VQVQGQGSGLGAIAGGVLGGVVGHQVGGGRGKDAMTILGAVGGGLTGNEVEKRQRASTVYDIRIRMADGSRRNFTQSQSLAVGQKVRVEGEQLMLDGAAAH
jgi:outer membrane lipoprotein SlyB